VTWAGITLNLSQLVQEFANSFSTHQLAGKCGRTVGASPLTKNSGDKKEKMWRVKRFWNNDPIDEKSDSMTFSVAKWIRSRIFRASPRDDKASKIHEYDPTASG
jgi:hypothetical protein